MTVRELYGDRDPLPAFGRDRLSFGFELFGHEAVEQHDVLKPAAVVVLEQIPQNAATRALIGIEAHKLRPAIGPAHGLFSEQPADLVRLVITGTADVLPDLLLVGVIGCDRERHELLERHAVFGIDLMQLRRHRRQPQPLLHDRRVHEVPGGDVFLAHAEVAEDLEGPKLIERMQTDPLVVLRHGESLDDALRARGATREEIRAIDNALDPRRGQPSVSEGQRVKLSFTDGDGANQAPRIARVAIYTDDKIDQAVARADDGSFVRVEQAPAQAARAKAKPADDDKTVAIPMSQIIAQPAAVEKKSEIEAPKFKAPEKSSKLDSFRVDIRRPGSRV